MKFQTLVNKVAYEMDADSDYNEAVTIAMDAFGASKETAIKVAKELGRLPPPKAPKLTEQQRRIAAAILGVSNAGSDHLFRGPNPEYGADDIKHLMKVERSVNDTTHYFVSGLCETEEMLDMFQGECRSWYKKLKSETLDNLSAVHKSYAHLFDAMRG